MKNLLLALSAALVLTLATLGYFNILFDDSRIEKDVTRNKTQADEIAEQLKHKDTLEAEGGIPDTSD